MQPGFLPHSMLLPDPASTRSAGDHNRNPRQHQCRQLVTDGLARTGGHNRQSIPPTQDRIHNALLPFPEGRIAKVFF